jgi:prepilin-type processing-associated H-X9-DG protein
MEEPSPTPHRLDYRGAPDPPPPKKPGPFSMSLASAITLLALIGMLVAMVWPKPMRSRPTPRVYCMSNLHAIGSALARYANENHGQFPDDLNALVAANMIDTRAFVCPSTNDTQATGPTTQAVVQQLQLPGHQSYIYLGKGLIVRNARGLRSSIILAYEPLTNHTAGSNVLFADGHVEFVPAARLNPILPKLKAATEPVTLSWPR